MTDFPQPEYDCVVLEELVREMLQDYDGTEFDAGHRQMIAAAIDNLAALMERIERKAA